MVKVHDKVVTVRIPNEVLEKLSGLAQYHHTDKSKLIKKCIKCFVNQSKCLVKKEIAKIEKGKI